MRWLHDTITDSTATDGVYLDKDLYSDVLHDNTKHVHFSHKEGTFQCFFGINNGLQTH